MAETRQCPPEFQERITRMFGRNEFGDPLFKIVWGESEFIRMGNIWRDKQGNERKGYRERYTCYGTCWMIMKWQSPAEFGSPNLYYQNTYDPHSGLYMTGEYPWKGRYVVMQALRRKEFVDGKLVIEHLPLTHMMIDKIIPLMIYAQNLSKLEQQMLRDFTREQKRKEQQRQIDEIADQMVENMPAWYGPVSYAQQGNRTALLDRKAELIQRQWDRLSRHGRRPNFRRGFQVGKAPRFAN